MTELPAPQPESKLWTKEAIAYYTRLFMIAIRNVATLVAILILIGFIVIQSYLLSITNLMVVNIDIRQYLVAGAHPFVSIFNILGSLEMMLAIVFAIALILVFGYSGFSSTYHRIELGSSKGIVRLLKRAWNLVLVLFSRVYRWLAPFVILLMVVFVVSWYGQRMYGKAPRILGGGEPSTVILVFDEPQDDAGWPFAINPTQPRQTQPIEMLMQLTDGVLVRDPQNPVPVIVKADSIRAIIDASPQRQPLPTATPSAAPTATP